MNLEPFGLVPFETSSAKPGDRFQHLTVLATGRVSGTYRYYAVCQCDCGSPPKRIRLDGLTSGLVEGCGCVRMERTVTHGLTKNPLYETWRHIIDRCTKPSDSAYQNYGGRGIGICDQWLDVRTFVRDLEHLYSPGLEIDRIDNDGNYEPGNVRFVSRAENADNRRSGRHFTYNNETKSVRQWSKSSGVPYPTLWERLVICGWDIEKALNTPSMNANERMAVARAAWSKPSSSK